MKNSNVKTNLTRKATAIASAVMTLSTAAVLAMAPMSQAQAVGLVDTGGFCSSKTAFKNNVRYNVRSCQEHYRAEGGASTAAGAFNDAKRRTWCPENTHIISAKWGKYGKWSPNWYYADLEFTCQTGRGGRGVR